MKRSFLTVVAASLFAIGACGGTDTDDNIEPVDELGPPPAPAPRRWPFRPWPTACPWLRCSFR